MFMVTVVNENTEHFLLGFYFICCIRSDLLGPCVQCFDDAILVSAGATYKLVCECKQGHLLVLSTSIVLNVEVMPQIH